jgi:hypothetical protein
MSAPWNVHKIIASFRTSIDIFEFMERDEPLFYVQDSINTKNPATGAGQVELGSCFWRLVQMQHSLSNDIYRR